MATALTSTGPPRRFTAWARVDRCALSSVPPEDLCMESSRQEPQQERQMAVVHTPQPFGAAVRPEVSAVEFLNLVLRQRRLVFGLPIVLVAVLTGVVLALPRTYTSSASFMPQSPQGLRSGSL